MKVLVTGGSGFIGGRLCLELAKRGIDVVATGRRPRPKFLDHPTIEYKVSLLEDEENIASLLQGCHAVFHCAGLTGVWGPYKAYEEANVLVTRRLLGACKKLTVERFIHLSSPSVYFQYKDQFNLSEEDIPTSFSNAYAQTKYLSEKEVLKENSSEFLTLCLRPRGVIGAGDRNWLPRIIELYNSGKLIIPGNGKNLVDFTSCANLVGLMADCLDLKEGEGPAVFGRSYNVSNGVPVLLWDFVTEALKALGVYNDNKPLKKLPLSLLMMLARVSGWVCRLFGLKSEPKILPLKVGVAAYSMTLNIDKAKTLLGYQPQQSTKEALAEFVAWWHNQGPSD